MNQFTFLLLMLSLFFAGTLKAQDNGMITADDKDNIFIVGGAGTEKVTGNANVFLGIGAGQENTSGDSNVFLGYIAGGSNTTGEANVFSGVGAGRYNTKGSGNVFSGYGAGSSNSTGEYNVFLGYQTGASNTTSSNNVFLGLMSGYSNTTGSGNVFIGNRAGQDNKSGYNNIIIGGYPGKKTEENNKLYIETYSNGDPLIYGDFDERNVVINGSGTSDSNNRTFFVNGSIGATSAFNNDSDRRLKKNIQTIPSALDKILEMRGVTFEWKDKREKGERMGFIAQEVEAVLPQVVDHENDQYTMQYAPVTAVLIEAVKEQQKQIAALTAEVNQLKMIAQQSQANLTQSAAQKTADKK